MNRREFLTVAGSVALAGLLGLKVSPVAAAQNDRMLYRGTMDGKLYESSDGGKSWQLITDFGSIYAIQSITPGDNNALTVELGYMGFGFNLHSADKSIWRTV
jgi:hypothetical protein